MAQCDELAYFKITTVEQLAGVSDANCQNFMGLSELRKRAQAFMQLQRDEAPMQRLQGELVSRDEQISDLNRQLEEMRQMISDIPRGRKRKAEAPEEVEPE